MSLEQNMHMILIMIPFFVKTMANKAYKFRIYPTLEQRIIFAKTFGCVRFIYNQMLSDKIKHYEKTRQKLNNTPAQYKKEYEWLKEVDSAR